jgi:hypothetical protein
MENSKETASVAQQLGRRTIASWLRFPPLNSTENRLSYLGLAGAGFLLFILVLPLLSGTVHEFDDLNNYHLPYRYFYAQCLKNGYNFTWIPDVFCGFYLHGEGQVGMFHPLHLFLYKFLPLNIAYNLELILSYPFMIAGMFFFLRRWKLPRDASMLGSLVFSLSGFNIMHYVHMNVVSVAAHTPWLLLAIDVVVRSENESKKTLAKLALALLTASQLLLGHPSTFWLSSVLEFLYVLFLIRPWNDIRCYAVLAEYKFLGVLLGAIQLLPHYEAAMGSERIHPSLDFLLWPSIHPIYFLQMVAPYFFNPYAYEGLGHDMKTYAGAIPLILFMTLFIRRKDLGKWRWPATGVIGLSIFSLLMAAGKYGYVYYLQLLLPLVRLLRTPCRYAFLFHFALATGAAIALADISGPIEQRIKLPWRKLSFLIILPAAATIPFLLTFWSRVNPDPTLAKYFVQGLNPQPTMLIAGFAFVVLAVALIAFGMRGRDLRFAIVLFVILDLFLYQLDFMGIENTRSIEDIVKSLPTPSADTRLYRVQSNDNIFILKHARLSGGYASIPPKKELDPLSGPRLRLANAHSVLEKNLLRFRGRAYGYSLPEPLPRVRMVSSAVVSQNPNADVNTVDVASTALVYEDVGLAGGPPGSASLVVDKPGYIQIAVECKTKQLLALSESYHGGWQARVDGTDVPVLPVYGDFMGCVLDAGSHTVTFRFLPKSLVFGAWISLTGIILTLFSFFWSMKKNAMLKAHEASFADASLPL